MDGLDYQSILSVKSRQRRDGFEATGSTVSRVSDREDVLVLRGGEGGIRTHGTA